MLEFLKKVFQKEEPRRSEISIEELEKRISNNGSYIVSQTKEDAKKIMREFNIRMNKLHWACEALKNSELTNPNIPVKAKQYMEGNREHYVGAILKWAEDVKYAANYEINEMRDFVRDFNASLDKLNMATIKSFNMLQEFFAIESGKVAYTIKELSELVKNLERLSNSQSLLDFEKISLHIQKLQEKIMLKESMEQDLSKLQSDIENMKKKKEGILNEVNNFKQTKEFVRYKELKQERQSLQEKINALEDRLIQSFSAIERALKKYSHIAYTHRDLASAYVKSPFDTLIGDKKFEIVEILSRLKDNIQSGAIKLEEPKKEKTIEEMKKLDRDFFLNIAGEHNSSMKRIKSIDREIKMLNLSPTMQGYNFKLNEMDFSIDKKEREKDKLQNAIQRLGIEDSAKELESLVRNSFDEISIRI